MQIEPVGWFAIDAVAVNRRAKILHVDAELMCTASERAQLDKAERTMHGERTVVSNGVFAFGVDAERTGAGRVAANWQVDLCRWFFEKAV